MTEPKSSYFYIGDDYYEEEVYIGGMGSAYATGLEPDLPKGKKAKKKAKKRKKASFGFARALDEA